MGESTEASLFWTGRWDFYDGFMELRPRRAVGKAKKGGHGHNVRSMGFTEYQRF